MVSAGMIGSRYKMERVLSIPEWTTVLLAKEFAVREVAGTSTFLRD